MDKVIFTMRGVCLAAAFAWLTVVFHEASAVFAASAKRTTVAILPFQDLSDGADSAHWGDIFPRLLETELRLKSVVVLPESSITFGFHELGLHRGQPMTAERTRALGRVIGANWVVWGDYRKDGNRWSATCHVVDVASGKTVSVLPAPAADWLAILARLGKAVRKEMKVVPTAEEQKPMNRPITASPEALELMSRFYGVNAKGEAMASGEEILRRALSYDPEFSAARGALALILAMQGKLSEGMQMAEAAVKSRPDGAGAHFALAQIYRAKGLKLLAREEILQALKFEPNDAMHHTFLAEVYSGQWNLVEAIAELQEARMLAPHDAGIPARLAVLYAARGERERALNELRTAESYLFDDWGIRRVIADCYALLHEAPKALAHYERLLEMANASEALRPMRKEIEDTLTDLKARGVPHFVPDVAPTNFTSKSLKEALGAKLTPEEFKLVSNPLASTPEMRKWAERLVGATKDPLEKAHRIFYGLTRRVNIKAHGDAVRGAAEAYRDWFDPNARIACHDYTVLFVAMARHVGLRADYAIVEKDFRDKYVNHACAALVIDGKTLLVDPAYQWFGVPHKAFECENDVRVISFCLSWSKNPAMWDIALKLVSDWAVPKLLVGIRLLDKGQPERGLSLIEEGRKLDSQSSLSLLAQARTETYRENWDAAASLLRECLAINPETPRAQFYLAYALHHLGRLAEAQEEYRIYLEVDDDGTGPEYARRAITEINAELAKKKE
jgi:tetratricopeptide (TPR) repeat protein/TolB-like protein